MYLTETDDESKTTVQFGDGVTGARLPTGRENVAATYRKGIGREGQVKAGQLSLLMTRPLGVKAVVNPLAAAGAADPQVTADAQRNAPLTVLTLDRIVSLQDYEDFARSYAGVAKALATWTWSGHRRGVLLTVAGANGDAVTAQSALHTNLVAAIVKAGDARVPVEVKSYRAVFFELAATVRVAPEYGAELVRAAIEGALRAAFSFDARLFGQPVAFSEVTAIIRNIPGVVFANVTTLHRRGATAKINFVLIADAPTPGANAPHALAAELLTLDAAPLDGLEVS